MSQQIKKIFAFCFFLLLSYFSFCQLNIPWVNVDSSYQPLPASVHVYYTDHSIDTGRFRAFYVVADLEDKKLQFTVDTSRNRRLTPTQFYQKNAAPLLVVNCTFFSFETNRSLNLVVKNGKIVANSQHFTALKGKDTLLYAKNLNSAIGITKNRKADVAWVYSDSTLKWPVAFEQAPMSFKDSSTYISKFLFAPELHHYPPAEKKGGIKSKWKVQTAVGGGPVLVHDGQIEITNNEERKFMGKEINDKHPRTAIGYTKDGKLIILMIEGRNPKAGGATLQQEAEIFTSLGCVEALNLDGGGSSCLLINGKETITVSDKTGQRPVPAVFLINWQH